MFILVIARGEKKLLLLCFVHAYFYYSLKDFSDSSQQWRNVIL